MVFSGKDDRRRQEFTGANRFVDLIPSHLNAMQHSESSITIERRASNSRKVLIVKPDLEQVQKIKNSFSYFYPYGEETRLPLKGSVTGVLKNLEEEQVPVYVVFDEQTTDAERGTIAHKFLEHYDFSRLKSVNEQAQEMVKDGILTAEELAKINIDRIKTALFSGVFDGIKSKSLFREKNFLVNIEAREILPVKSNESVLLQGVIDLLVIDGDEAEIIDNVKMVLNSTGGTGYIHEGVDKDDDTVYSRAWFAWANSLFAYMVLEKREILADYSQF